MSTLYLLRLPKTLKSSNHYDETYLASLNHIRHFDAIIIMPHDKIWDDTKKFVVKLSDANTFTHMYEHEDEVLTRLSSCPFIVPLVDKWVVDGKRDVIWTPKAVPRSTLFYDKPEELLLRVYPYIEGRHCYRSPCDYFPRSVKTCLRELESKYGVSHLVRAPGNFIKDIQGKVWIANAANSRICYHK